MNIAITGGNGQLGNALCREFGKSAISLSHSEADITNMDSLRQLVFRCNPGIVINCAAYTAVDRAEQDAKQCYACNAEGVKNLASLCNEFDIRFVQLSTDYVFGGDTMRRTPYLESDSADPLSIYGYSKLQGEKYAQSTADHLIVRTCGLYGSIDCHNFVNAIVGLTRTRRQLRVVSDQRCTPSLVEDVAKGVKFLVNTGAQGVFHVVNEGSTIWSDFAREIIEFLRVDVEVSEVTSSEYGAPAMRPAYSVLDTQKYNSEGGPRLRNCCEALRWYLSSQL